MRRRTFLTLTPSILAQTQAVQTANPNIVFILADDVGWGDAGCYGAKSIHTPNIDRLASRGVRFTDAHSTSATCTPSRYAIMTGEYPWRRKDTAILPGDARLIIQPGRTTLPSMLQKAGYATGCVGKWHLGMGSGNLDWNTQIRPGPNEVGFDYSFIIPATADRVPCVYVENGRVAGLDPKDPIRVSYSEPAGNEPTGRARPDLLKVHPSHGHDMTIVNGISRIGYMAGGKSARWVDEDMADTITRKAQTFIDSHRTKPFFLYFGTNDIHVPRVPHPRFRGTSGAGTRGDVMQELDWSVGQILDTLDRHNLAENTVVIFTSDNGPVVDDGYQDGAVQTLGDHKPAGPYRGGKYSNFEGGTRVPFIVRWPRHITPGVSNALFSQVDLLASFASLTHQKLDPAAAPDSFDMLPVLTGKSKTGRDYAVEHARVLSIRRGPWKLISKDTGPAVNRNTNTEMGAGLTPQLYNLDSDPGERTNIAAQNPEKVEELTQLLARVSAAAKTRP